MMVARRSSAAVHGFPRFLDLLINQISKRNLGLAREQEACRQRPPQRLIVVAPGMALDAAELRFRRRLLAAPIP